MCPVAVDTAKLLAQEQAQSAWTGKIEFLRSTNNNTWGLGFSEEGLVFGSTANGNPSVHLPIPNRYYEAVLGWSLAPGRVADGWEDQGVTPMVGVHGGQTDDLGLVPMYAVDDIEVAVAAVRTAGGRAGEIEQQSFGLSAQCHDDQGLPFFLGQLG